MKASVANCTQDRISGLPRKLVWTFVALALGVLIGYPTFGQQGRWEELTGQVNQLYASGRATDAIPTAKKAIEVAKSSFGETSANYALSLNNLALLYSALRQYSEAEPLFDRAISILEKKAAPEVTLPLGNLSNMYAAQGNFAKAESAGSRALEAVRRTMGPESVNAAVTEIGLAQIYLREGRLLDAERACKSALSIEAKALPAEHLELAKAHSALGYVYEGEGRGADAESEYRTALPIFQSTVGPNDPMTTSTKDALARITAHSIPAGRTGQCSIVAKWEPGVIPQAIYLHMDGHYLGYVHIREEGDSDHVDFDCVGGNHDFKFEFRIHGRRYGGDEVKAVCGGSFRVNPGQPYRVLGFFDAPGSVKCNLVPVAAP